MSNKNKLFCFGYGYSCEYLGHELSQSGETWTLAGTTRDHEKRTSLQDKKIEAHIFDYHYPLADPHGALAGTTHLLISTPPGDEGDPAFLMHMHDIIKASGIQWVGYLSTTGVYGNRDGDWVDEDSQLKPTSRRGKRRVKAEEQWLSLFEDHGLPVHIFRLAGIYGPGRSALDSIRAGVARRIDKPGQAFSRIHVEDIINVLRASMRNPRPGQVYNVCDDMAAPSHEVISYACDMLGKPKPPMLPYKEADLAPITLSFYADNKRVRNDRIKNELGVELKYKTFKEGLHACKEAEDYAVALFKGMRRS